MLNAIVEGTEGLENLSGTADGASKDVENGIAAQAKALWNTFKELASTIGTSLVPVLTGLADKAKPIVEQVTTWVKENPKLVGTLVGVAGAAAAIGPILSTVGGAITVASLAMQGLSVISSGALVPALVAIAPIAAIAGAVLGVALASKIGDSSTALLGLQDKFGTFGFFLGGTCELISGLVQGTFGGVAIIIQGVMEVIQAVVTGKFNEIPDIISKTGAQMELNTKEAFDKVTMKGTIGMDALRNATDSKLKGVNASMDTIMDAIPNIVDGKYRTASTNLGNQLSKMDKEQISILQGMNDTTARMFDGIKEGMTVDVASKKVESNLKQMAKAGKIDTENMNKDIDSAMKMISSNMDKKTSEGSKKVDTNLKSAKTSVKTNTDSMKKDAKSGMDSVATSFMDSSGKIPKDVQKSMNASTTAVKKAGSDMYNGVKGSFDKMASEAKSAATAMYKGVSTSVNNMANKSKEYATAMYKGVTTSANKMASEAKSAASTMYRGVTTSTNKMANEAIADWNRIKKAYSNTITGKVNVVKSDSKTKSVMRGNNIRSVPQQNQRSQFAENTSDLTSLGASIAAPIAEALANVFSGGLQMQSQMISQASKFTNSSGFGETSVAKTGTTVNAFVASDVALQELYRKLKIIADRERIRTLGTI